MQNIIGQQTEAGNISYQYDQIDQLIGVTNQALGNEQYSYDPMGNRLASSNAILGVTNISLYSVNSLNQYSEIVSSTNDASRTTLLVMPTATSLTRQVPQRPTPTPGI